jgi:hypothetical protein
LKKELLMKEKDPKIIKPFSVRGEAFLLCDLEGTRERYGLTRIDSLIRDKQYDGK